MFAAGPRGTAGTGTGPNMASRSSLTEHLVVVLNTILGRVNREGDLIENGLLLYPDVPRPSPGDRTAIAGQRAAVADPRAARLPRRDADRQRSPRRSSRRARDGSGR